MEIKTQRVFVDANVWIRWGTSLSSAEAFTLEELVNLGLVQIVSTDLTMSEVAKRFAKLDFDKVESLTKNEVKQAAMRYLGIDVPAMDREALRRKIFDDHFGVFSNALRERFRTQIHSIDAVKPSEVLDDYTHGRRMFSASAKKDQFPDAFIFGTLSRAAKEKGKIYILSHDDDFATACESSEHLERIDSFPRLLEVLGVEPEHEQTLRKVEQSTASFTSPLFEMLVNYSLDADDVDDAEIEVLGVSEARVRMSSMFKVRKDAHTYFAFGEATITADVFYTHPDWENGIYDSEDGIVVPLDNVEGETETEINDVPFSCILRIEDDGQVFVSNCEVKGRGYVSASLYPHIDYF